MELRQLRYFVGVARELNFTKAAQKLRVAQPALSRQIRQLEEEMGVRLLERNRRGVALTPAGHAFLREAQTLLERSEQAIRLAQGTEMAARGQMHLGFVWGLFHSLVPPLLHRYRQAHPHVAVHLLDLTATEQAGALTAGKLDAGFIGFAYEADTAKLAKRKVGECSFVAVLPQNHRLARRARVALSALKTESFVGISSSSYPGAWHAVLEACRLAGFEPHAPQAAERGYTILGMVAAKCGVALLPEPLRALPHPGVVFRPLESFPAADLFMAWHPARESLRLKEFLSSIAT